MNPVRFGIIGLGMGGLHARNLKDGKVPRAVLGAVCDVKPERLKPFADVPQFTSSAEMVRSGMVDVVVVATPHYSHPDLAIEALQAGLHVVVEKPIAVHKSEAERLVRASRPGGPLLGVMLNQRTDPRYRQIRQIMQSGALGNVQRVQWTITDWFRTDVYFRASDWRGTWAGEGGGLLMNQCPHQIDLLQWLFGMPRTVRATCCFGKYHDIEVEDEVTAVFEYPNGATGIFSASTAEAPGVNRLEAAGDRGRLVLEGKRLEWVRNTVDARTFSRTATDGFSVPSTTSEVFTFSDSGPQHVGILKNMTDAILDGTPLLAPGADGLPSVELANAMLFSSVRHQQVELPLSGPAVAGMLAELIELAARRHATRKA
ncbi:MAG: Gfo/Idh/MocA family oxidoreductase [Lentisphaerae bacterium]|nr:Gfo/Idh/MocA family oxidoreductase [Lentisphaerota bacterium]